MGLRLVTCSTRFLELILRGPNRPVESSLPSDLEVVGVIQTALDQESQRFSFVCRSAEWDQPVEGAAIPQIDATFTTVEVPVDV